MDWHVQKDSQRTQLRGSFLRSVLASDYFRCYAKYTSNILNFTLCNFKELIISPEIQPPIQAKKNSSRREKLNYRHTTNFHHNFSLPQDSVTNGYLGLMCYTRNEILSSHPAQMTSWNNLLLLFNNMFFFFFTSCCKSIMTSSKSIKVDSSMVRT